MLNNAEVRLPVFVHDPETKERIVVGHVVLALDEHRTTTSVRFFGLAHLPRTLMDVLTTDDPEHMIVELDPVADDDHSDDDTVFVFHDMRFRALRGDESQEQSV